jgi:hypothetical protein
VETLDDVMLVVRMYLAPVEAVVAEAAVAAKVASAQARTAADMSRRGPFAEGEGAESPEFASYAPPGPGEGTES